MRIQFPVSGRSAAVEPLHVARFAAKSDFTLRFGSQQFVPDQADVSRRGCGRQIDAAADVVRILVQNYPEESDSGSLCNSRRSGVATNGLRAPRHRVDAQVRRRKNSRQRLNKVEKGVGAENRAMIEPRIEVPKIYDPLQF